MTALRHCSFLLYAAWAVLLLACLSLPTFAQPSALEFNHITVRDGLPNNRVQAIYQDRLGFMWFGTRGGLCRYDGYTIKVYRNIEGDSTSLFGNVPWDINEDPNGNLWVTSGALHKYDRNLDRFIRYTPDPSSPMHPQGFVSCVISEPGGTLWVGGTGLDKFDPATGIFIRIELGGTHKIIWAMATDNIGNLWMGTAGGEVIRLDKATLQFERIPNPRLFGEVHQICVDGSDILVAATGLFRLEYRGKWQVDSLFMRSAMTVCVDSAGRLWSGTFSDGLQQWDRDGKTFTTFKHSSSDPRTLHNSFIERLYVDRQGNLWVGSADGVSLLSNWRKRFRHIIHNTDNPNSLVDGEVRTILEDSHGDLWIGTFGGGLSRWDRKADVFRNYTDRETGPNLYHTIVYEDRNATVWIGTNQRDGLVRWDRQRDVFFKDQLAPVEDRRNWVAAMLEVSDGAFWLGTGNGMCLYDRDTRQKRWYALDTVGSPWVRAVYEDRSKRLWVGAAGGFYEYDRIHDRFVRRHDVHAWSIHEDRANRMWLGTSRGLMLYDRNVDSLVSALTDKSGLGGESVYGILEDDHGTLWLGTNKGLTKYHPDAHIIQNYDPKNGFPFSGINRIAFGYNGYHKARRGEMMFSTGNGFVVFHPDSIRDNSNVPPVVITDFKLFNEPVRIAPDSPLKQSIVQTKSFVLAHDQNTIAFEFAALDYTVSGSNQYKHKLEGFDNDWVHIGTRNFAQYTNLSPGEYTFRVKGSNSDGVWNEQGAAIAIIITPPWWKTVWAYIGYGLVVVGVLYTIRRSEKNRDQLKHQAELEHTRAESLQEVDSLKSRFFANISHEFRTPLTLIKGPLENMIAEEKEEKKRQHLGMMQRNADRLLRLINQLLDLSKLEGGAMKLQASPGNIVSLVKGLTSSFESSAGMKRVAIVVDAESDDIEMYFDRDKVEKILTNLLSNAFKFTAEGGSVSVSLRAIPTGRESEVISLSEKGIASSLRGTPRNDETSGGFVSITICDTGVGIPQDQLDKVFDRFYQVDASQTREHEGSGIGLALTKELVELHHGTISVKSEVGKGTSFTVRLPLGRGHLKDEEIVEGQEPLHATESLRIPLERDEAISPPEREIASSLESAPRNDRKPLVLVVEDNADVRAYMREYLVKGYDVQEAHDGAEGIEKAKEIVPDLIISDVMMPKKDGYELCKTLKLDEKTSHIPIILLTAKAGTENKIEGLETGADDYLTKPFDAKELLVRVKNLIELRRKLRERFRVGEVLKPGDIAVTSIDDAFLQKAMAVVERRMGDEKFGTEQLRDELGMSRTQLHRKLTALTNQSAGDFIRYMRLQRAKTLLTQNAGTVSEIAFQVGFNSVAYFTKCFREQFGVVPSEARTIKE